jgi:hypothetical protein
MIRWATLDGTGDSPDLRALRFIGSDCAAEGLERLDFGPLTCPPHRWRAILTVARRRRRTPGDASRLKHRRCPSASSNSTNLAQPLAPALAQASVRLGHCPSSSGLWTQSHRPRQRRKNSRILRGQIEGGSTKSRRCHRVASAADKASVEDGTSHIQLGALGAPPTPTSEQWEGVLRKKTPRCVFFLHFH